MNLKDLFRYNLVETENMTISVNDILFVVVILIATWLLLWLIKRVIARQSKKKGFDIGKGRTIILIIKYVIWIIAIILALETIGVRVTILLASSAALLVGLGLGIQKIFMDIVSGITILFESTIKVGDVVEIEDGLVGKVEEITLRTSKLRSRDNIIVIIPNSKFINEDVINWSHMDMKTRFDVNVSVAYGSDVDKVKGLLIKCAEENKDVASSPAPMIHFSGFGESSLLFTLYFWSDQTFYVENTKSDIRFAINKKFKENKITIPFPQRDIHMKNNN